MSIGPYILLLPDIALEKIFSFLSFDEIARNREACLSVDNVQKVMIIGRSKDFGTCKSTRKDGTPCSSFVNINQCAHCIYHVKHEYQKCSRRSELQATFSGGGLTRLRNKVLGKHEVFYAGKSFTAIKNKKLQAKDEKRISLLSGKNVQTKNCDSGSIPNKTLRPKGMVVEHVEISAKQRIKDLELLKKLGRTSSATKTDLDTHQKGSNATTTGTWSVSTEVSLQESKSTALSVIAKLKTKKASNDWNVGNATTLPQEEINQCQSADVDEMKSASAEMVKEANMQLKAAKTGCDQSENVKDSPSISSSLLTKKMATHSEQLDKVKNSSAAMGGRLNVPVLSGIGNKMIDLSSPVLPRHIHRANLNAVKWVQRNGPIKKENPNKTSTPRGMKRVLEAVELPNSKRAQIEESDLFSQRFKAMMAATSKHADLLVERENEEAEKYFERLEAKEKMEEKMMSTYKVQCKAVRCLQCKYTSFSAADRCKKERHPLKVYDATKRFFKCGDCGNRTASLNLIPTRSCTRCSGGKWERAGMMNEKIVMPATGLSIRGGEQEHINSNVTNANINLLVPDD